MEHEYVHIESGTTHLKIGTFECDLGADGYGWVKLDGQRVKCCGFKCAFTAGEVPHIILDVVPL